MLSLFYSRNSIGTRPWRVRQVQSHGTQSLYKLHLATRTPQSLNLKLPLCQYSCCSGLASFKVPNDSLSPWRSSRHTVLSVRGMQQHLTSISLQLSLSSFIPVGISDLQRKTSSWLSKTPAVLQTQKCRTVHAAQEQRKGMLPQQHVAGVKMLKTTHDMLTHENIPKHACMHT